MSVTVRAGSVRIQVHLSPKRIGGRSVNDWEFRWRDGAGRLRRLKRARRADAIAEARRIANELAEGRSAELSGRDVASFRAGVINLCGCGVTIEVATAEYAEARKRLGTAGSVIEAADFFVRHCAGGGSDKLIADVVQELLKARAAAGAGALHLKDLEQRLTRFSGAVKCPIRQLNAPVISDWLGALDLSPRSVKNYRGAVSNLVEFAITRKYLPPDFAEMRFVAAPKAAENEVEIFTIAEMRLLLRHASQSLLPVLVLGGFAGLRTSETREICWEHVHWGKGFITVPRGKTGKRLAPLMDNAAQWLRWIRDGAAGAGQGTGADGRIVRIAANTVNTAMMRAVVAVNRELTRERVTDRIAWKHNALRHSFVTYWTSFEHDLWKVSERTGHGVRVLKRNYQRPEVLPDTGRAWFEIRPDARGQALQLSLFSSYAKICPLTAPSEKPCEETAQNQP